MFPHKTDEYLGLFADYLADFVAACPSTKPIADEIEGFVKEGKIYKALKHTQKLIAHQADVLKSLESGIEKATADIIVAEGDATGAGEENGTAKAD